MNRKLHTSIFACTASTATLVLGLLVAWPAASADPTGMETAPARTMKVSGDARPQSGPTSVDTAPATPPRSRSKRARSAIAMPYFSFARGTGGRS